MQAQVMEILDRTKCDSVLRRAVDLSILMRQYENATMVSGLDETLLFPLRFLFKCWNSPTGAVFALGMMQRKEARVSHLHRIADTTKIRMS